jgi:hypothetical protein
MTINHGEPHVVVLHRWVGPVALYADYLNHEKHKVTYVTTAAAYPRVPKAATEIVVIRTSGHIIGTDPDLERIETAVRQLARRHGKVRRLIALHEGDLELAARLRERLGIPGERQAEIAPFRDKWAMARVIEAHDISAPVTALVIDRDGVADFGERHGWPIVVKPRTGTSSLGVLKIESAAHLDELDIAHHRTNIVQTFIDSPIIHVDGFYDGEVLGWWTASRYLNTCMDFTFGNAFGSAEISEPAALAHIGAFTTEVLAAMATGPRVFHLELFALDEQLTRFSFLEIAARVGGAEIPYIWRDVHGRDLVGVAFGLQYNGSVPDVPAGTGSLIGAKGEVGGWLVVPPDVPRPCRVVAAPSQVRPGGPYGEVVPAVGDLVPAGGGYETTCARFRFRGYDSHQVEAAIIATMESFTLHSAAPEVRMEGSLV